MELKAKDYLFVGIQFLLFLIYLLDFKLIDFNLPFLLRILFLILAITGLLLFFLAILQLNKNLSPFPSPKLNSELVQNGVYKFMRHPIYSGILISFFSFGIITESLFRVLVSGLLSILFLYKSKYEEEMLLRKFENYSEYRKKTGRFFPKIFS